MGVEFRVRPYKYEGPYPFSASGDSPVLLSGIFLEQAILALNSEADIWGYTTFWKDIFTVSGYRVFHSTLPKEEFAPTSGGDNLGGVNDDPPCSLTHSYLANLTETRDQLEQIIQYTLSNDTEYQKNDIWKDYLISSIGNLSQYQVPTWRYSEQEEVSGIHDISIREISYNPFPRFTRGFVNGIPTIGQSVIPLFPSCIDTDGNLPSIRYDDTIDFITNLYGSGSASALHKKTFDHYKSGIQIAKDNKFAVFGDMIFSGITELRIANDADDTIIYCEGDGTRDYYNADSLDNGIGIFNRPSGLSSGVYNAYIYNNTNVINDIYIPKSGTIISTWPPPRLKYAPSGWLFPFYSQEYSDNYPLPFEVLDCAIFSGRTQTGNCSGVSIISPHTAMPHMFNFVDKDTGINNDLGSPIHWPDIAGVSTINADNIVCLSRLSRAAGSYYKPIFLQWDKTTLEFQSAKTTNAHNVDVRSQYNGSPQPLIFVGDDYQTPISYPTGTPLDIGGYYLLNGANNALIVVGGELEMYGSFGGSIGLGSRVQNIIFWDNSLYCINTTSGVLEEVYLFFDSQYDSLPAYPGFPYQPSGIHRIGTIEVTGKVIDIMHPSGGQVTLRNHYTDPSGTALDYEDNSILIAYETTTLLNSNNAAPEPYFNRLTPAVSGGQNIALITKVTQQQDRVTLTFPSEPFYPRKPHLYLSTGQQITQNNLFWCAPIA